MKPTTLSLLSLFLTTTSAIPNVTPIPLPTDTCVHWPSWINSRPSDTTGSLALVVSSSEDATIEGDLGQPFTTSFNGNNTAGHRDYVGITLLNTRFAAKAFYRCNNGHLVTHRIEPLRISASQNAHLVLNGEANEGKGWESYQPQVYRHVVDGKQVDGLFLGAMNKTTWGFTYRDSEGCAGRNGWWEMRLLDVPHRGGAEWVREVMFKGFIKVVSWP